MDVLILFAGFILLLYLITRKWFWMTVIVLCALGLLFTPLASIMMVAILIASGFVILHLLFLTLMFILSTLFLFG